MLRPVLVTPPTLAVVTLDQAKAWCRVEHSNEDAKIQDMLAAAVSYLDGAAILGVALAPQTWSQKYSEFSDRMSLLVGPVLSITSITYRDSANALQTLGAAVYDLQIDAQGDYVFLNADQVWPSIYIRDDAVTITWQAGYAGGVVPPAIKATIRMMVTQMYDDPEGAKPIPAAATGLMSPFLKMSV